VTRRKAQPQAAAPANDDAFPEEAPESGPSEPAEPERVSNAERVARQGRVFGDAEQRVDGKALAALTPKPRAAPRRVSAEVVKAETKLLALERRRQDSFAHAEAVWAAKRAELIRSFPADVLAALLAMNVLDGEELGAIEGLG
jgi:hypothetical protein